MINTIIGISVALDRYKFIQLVHIGTHPLENYFGCIRIACHNDHSYCNIFRAIGKAIYSRKLLNELKQENIIGTRLGIGGAHAKIECVDGLMPDISPFQLFKLIWNQMKDKNADITIFNSWFSSYRTVEWEEEITQASKLSGSGVISRYLNLANETKNRSKPPKINMKCTKQERIEKIKKLKRIYKMTSEEINYSPITDALQFFVKIIQQLITNFKKNQSMYMFLKIS